jgi:hypothetical protein
MDKEVFESFLLKKPEEKVEEDDYLNWLGLKKFLRKESELVLNFNLKKEEENLTHKSFATLLASFAYSGTRIECNPNLFRFKQKLCFQTTFSKCDLFFWLHENEVGQLSKWQQNNGFFISSENELLQSWEKLNLTDRAKYPGSLPVRDYEIENNLSNWSGLEKYKHPVTDVVFCDPYFFSNENLFEINFIPFLRSVINNTSAHFNLSIFTSNHVFQKNISKLKHRIEALLAEAKLNCSLTLVINSANQYKEHDRGLITNYFHFVSGDSFNFFTGRDSLKTSGTTIQINPLVRSDCRNNAIAILKNLKRIYDHRNVDKIGNLNNRLFECF